jgi:sugar/nucleoside kinase (ribokinase family)
VLFVSDEDLGERRDQLERWIKEVPIVALTRYRRGAQVYSAGSWRQIRAFPTVERDPTGAGDVFATAFLVRYHETKQVAESARFASAAAACSVEGAGVDAVADRAAIEARMEEHPEILLQ